MGINIKSVTCSQCGSSDVKVMSDELAVCNSCGSTIVIKPDVINIVGDIAGKGNDEIIKFVLVPDSSIESTKALSKEFMRAVFIKIAGEDVPLDLISSVNFKDFKCEPYELLSKSMDFELSYSASVGYNRQEPYLDTEYYTERVNGQNVQRTRQVTKYRTVVDWRPISGTYRSSQFHSTSNDPAKPFATEYENAVLAEMKKRKNDDIGFITEDITISPESDAFLTELNRDIAQMKCKYSLPGEHMRDFTCSIISEKVSQEVVVQTIRLSCTAEYAGEEYDFSALAIGGMLVAQDKIIENPESHNKKYEEEKQSIEKEFNEKMKAFKKKMMIISGALFGGGGFLYILLLGLHVDVPGSIGALTMISFLAGLFGLIYYYNGGRAFGGKKIEEEKNAKWYDALARCGAANVKYMDEKLERLNARFDSLGLKKAEMSEIKPKRDKD